MRQNKENVSPMSNEGRNAYVVERLTDALVRLLEDKTMDEISISELCETAEVGRASFYRNFGSKEELLKVCLNGVFREWVREYEKNQGGPLRSQLQTLLAHFEQRREFYMLLNRRGFIYLLKDALSALYGPRPEHPAAEAYARAFAVYSLYGWIEVWFQRGMGESAEEIAALFQAQGL